MRVGIPKERLRHEHRVGLTPFGTQKLTSLGHDVLIETGAGDDAHFSDEDYRRAGATIAFSREEVLASCELICRVGTLDRQEVMLLEEGAAVCGFLHATVAPRDMLALAIERRVSLISYEIIEDHAGARPMLIALSEIAGKLAVQVAGHLLQHEAGGRGLVLGGVPGIAPATVVILGAGTVGRTAAQTAQALGAHVIVLDIDLGKLRSAVAACGPHLVTALATARNLEKFALIADVLIGAVSIPGGRAPSLITRAVVARMKKGSAILDLSIDQGGCIETSRPTTLGSPTFSEHGVTHYCVPNMTANVARTASRALTISALPYLTWIAEGGLEGALRADAGLRRGVSIYRGQVVHPHLAQALSLNATHLDDLLGLRSRGEDPGRELV